MKNAPFRLLQLVCILVLLTGVAVEALLAILIEDRSGMEDRVHRF